MDSMTTVNNTIKCSECGNDVLVDSNKSAGDFFECEYCGIEYQIISKDESNEFIVKISEEEK